MQRSFLAATALVAIFALAASTASAQSTFFSDDFSTASGTSSPNWSVTVTDLGGGTAVGPNSIGPWRFDDPQPMTFGFTSPIATPFASADSDGAGGGTIYSTSLRSTTFDTTGATQVLLEFDYSFADIFAGESVTVEGFDGAVWNPVATLADNDPGQVGANSLSSFDITAMVGTSANARIRYNYLNAAFAWHVAVDNVNVFEPAAVDVQCDAFISPVVLPTNCLAGLSAAETVSFGYTNAGSGPINPGTLIQCDVDVNGTTVLTEFINQAIPLAGGVSSTYATTGTVDLSVLGPYTIDVTLTLIGDVDPSNDVCSTAFTLPGSTPRALGYSEDFNGLSSNAGSFNMIDFSVPTDWENALDDAASLAGNAEDQWGPNNGATGSTNAGPVDDNSGGGIYMYIEDSPSQAGDIELRTPCLDTSGAAGIPTFQFFHHSRQAAGSTLDNILEVDVINESTGGTVTASVLTVPGNGSVGWVQAQVDLSAFAPDLVKIQFRTNNNNGNFTDDVAVDDVLFFDAIPSIGQAPQPGNAVFDINNSVNGLGNNVASGQNGPYNATITAGGDILMTWSGQTNGIVICLFGPANDNIASFPGVGQLDIGTLPLSAGVPANIFVFGDGTPASQFPFGPLINSFFVTGPAGDGGVSFLVPDSFVPGPLTRFQCVMNPAGQFFTSNAVDVTVM